jgi:hypothetical protein
MTQIFPEIKNCGNCGTQNETFVVASTNAFGSPDLDLRPAEMARSTLSYQVQNCSNCSYCSNDIASFENDFKEILESKEYLNIFRSEESPITANYFLCHAMFMAAQNKWDKAAWATLNAAWICDDENHPNRFGNREKAIALFEQAIEMKEISLEEKTSIQCVAIDLYRLLGETKLARKAIKDIRFGHPYLGARITLHYQEYLSESGDLDIHTIDEAFEYAQQKHLYPEQADSKGDYFLVQISSPDEGPGNSKIRGLYRLCNGQFQLWLGTQNNWLITDVPVQDSNGPFAKNLQCVNYYWVKKSEAKVIAEEIGGNWDLAYDRPGIAGEELNSNLWANY